MTRLLALALFVVTWASCSTAAQQSKPQTGADVVATVGATTITLAQVDDVALQQPASNFGSARLAQALYQAQVSGDVKAADWRVSVEDARPDSLAVCDSLQSVRVPIVKLPLVE